MNTSSIRTIRALSLAAVAMIAFSSPTKAASETKPAPAPAAVPELSTTTTTPAMSTEGKIAPVPQSEREFYSAAPIRLEEVEVLETRATALTHAPTESSLDVYQPQSVIDLPFISNHLTPTADYSTIASLSPNVSNVTTNGQASTMPSG